MLPKRSRAPLPKDSVKRPKKTLRNYVPLDNTLNVTNYFKKYNPKNPKKIPKPKRSWSDLESQSQSHTSYLANAKNPKVPELPLLSIQQSTTTTLREHEALKKILSLRLGLLQSLINKATQLLYLRRMIL